MLVTVGVKAQPISIKKDSVIPMMLDEVSAKNIEATVRKLVSFQTRHTLSDTLSTKTGIGAARNWIKSEFEKYAKNCCRINSKIEKAGGGFLFKIR
jgi:hypothetical protein